MLLVCMQRETIAFDQQQKHGKQVAFLSFALLLPKDRQQELPSTTYQLVMLENLKGKLDSPGLQILQESSPLPVILKASE